MKKQTSQSQKAPLSFFARDLLPQARIYANGMVRIGKRLARELARFTDVVIGEQSSVDGLILKPLTASCLGSRKLSRTGMGQITFSARLMLRKVGMLPRRGSIGCSCDYRNGLLYMTPVEQKQNIAARATETECGTGLPLSPEDAVLLDMYARKAGLSDFEAAGCMIHEVLTSWTEAGQPVIDWSDSGGQGDRQMKAVGS